MVVVLIFVGEEWCCGLIVVMVLIGGLFAGSWLICQSGGLLVVGLLDCLDLVGDCVLVVL